MYQYPDYLMHYGVLGMKWGRRRAQKKSTKHIKKVANEAYSRSKKISDAYSAVRDTSEYTRHQGNVKSYHDKWSKTFNKSEKDFERRSSLAKKQASRDKSNPFDPETKQYRKYQEGLEDRYLQKIPVGKSEVSERKAWDNYVNAGQKSVDDILGKYAKTKTKSGLTVGELLSNA